MTNQQLAVNTIKGLAMDAVQKANSGHPGMPMGMADLGVILWTEFLKVNPDVPTWADRDRFVLSNGHGSMLLYSLLHLAGFDVSLDDIRNFRQWGSPTAGHPERDLELGIEMTTGPLGQGFGAGVGMAIGEAHLAAKFGSGLVDHRTWGFVSDGDLMEGISYETASLAGHLGLGKLSYFYDDNEISIDGSTDMTFTEDVTARFRAINWHVLDIDGHDHAAIKEAAAASMEVGDQPTLIVAHTHIGHGSPNKQDTSSSHGSPLGDEEIFLTKEGMGWPTDETFTVAPEALELFSNAMDAGRAAYAHWQARTATSDRFAEFEAQHAPVDVSIDGPGFDGPIATRTVTGKIFDEMAAKVPGFIGGSADLVGSTKTQISGSGVMSSEDYSARNIAFGIREHAMGTIVNGLTLHGGLRAYGATFFVFSDYMRPALRLSALMSLPSIWNFSHESIFLGEDGPTHQPVEHLASLRAMPNMWVMRPADAAETIAAWESAFLRSDGPTTILTTRQNLPQIARSSDLGTIAQGGYVVRDGADAILIATGSEVSTMVDAADLLEADDIFCRVVSLPCWEQFFSQSSQYQADVLGSGPRISLEAGSTFGWHAIVGSDGLALGLDRFGASAPMEILAEKLRFTPVAVRNAVRSHLDQ
jgi:transketolase